jgi:hypothetical protein
VVEFPVSANQEGISTPPPGGQNLLRTMAGWFKPDVHDAGATGWIPAQHLLILRILSWGAAAVMLVSLALPWGQLSNSGAFSYMSGMTMMLSNGPGAILKEIQQEPDSLLLCVPLLMTILLIGAAAYAFTAHQSRIRTAGHVMPQAVLSLAGGVPGVLAAVYFFVGLQKTGHQISAFIPMDLSNFIGPGIPLFAIASFVATAAGVWGLILMSQHQ